MDLAVGAREVWAIMEHNTRSGAPRLLERCALPLTAVRCVRRVFTDIAVVDVTMPSRSTITPATAPSASV
jgi:3-oxoadipate CoA-transferase beta subunit